MSDHRFCCFDKGKLTRLPGLPDAVAALKKHDVVWFDLYDPTREELSSLAEPLGLSPLSIEDALDEDQVPKFEDFPSYTFILFNTYRYEDELSLREFDFFLGRDFLLTVHRSPGGRFFGNRIDERIKAELNSVKRGPDALCHVLLDHLVDDKFAVIEKLQDQLDDAEERILEDPMGFKPEALLRLRRRLLTVRKSLVHEREVLVRICRKDSPFISEKGIYDYRDIHDHLVRFSETTEMCREVLSNLREIHLSLLNNRMTVAANQTNLVVKRLTLITTIFMPLTLLAGVFGMSEWSMMTGADNWRLAYPAFFGLMAAVAAVNWLLLRWVDRRSAAEAEGEANGTTVEPAPEAPKASPTGP